MEGKLIKKENIFKYIVYFFIAAAAFAIIKFYITPEPVDVESNKDMTMFIQNAISDVDLKLKNGTKGEDIATWLSWNKSNAALYVDAKSNKDKAIKRQSEVLKERIIKVQARDFPDLRNAFIDSKKEVLSKENIQIATSGKTNEVLTFTGNIYESAKVKKDFLKGIDQIVKDLRFKKVVFKWSENKADFTDFEVKSKNDSEI